MPGQMLFSSSPVGGLHTTKVYRRNSCTAAVCRCNPPAHQLTHAAVVGRPTVAITKLPPPAVLVLNRIIVYFCRFQPVRQRSSQSQTFGMQSYTTASLSLFVAMMYFWLVDVSMLDTAAAAATAAGPVNAMTDNCVNGTCYISCYYCSSATDDTCLDKFDTERQQTTETCSSEDSCFKTR